MNFFHSNVNDFLARPGWVRCVQLNLRVCKNTYRMWVMGLSNVRITLSLNFMAASSGQSKLSKALIIVEYCQKIFGVGAVYVIKQNLLQAGGRSYKTTFLSCKVSHFLTVFFCPSSRIFWPFLWFVNRDYENSFNEQCSIIMPLCW